MLSKIIASVSSNVTYTISAVLLAAVTCIILKTLLEHSLKLYRLWKAAKIFPGPTGLPVLGNALDVMKDEESLLKELNNWSKCYLSPFRAWLGHKLHIILYDPDSVKGLLQDQKILEKSELYSFMRDFGGNGLITATAKEWRSHRKLITTVIHNRVLPPYGAFLAEKAQEMVKEMEVELHGKGFNAHHYFSLCTLRMIFGVVLGTSLKYETEELNDFLKNALRFLEIVFIRIPRIWLHPNIIFNRTSLGREFNGVVKRLATTIERAHQRANLTHAKGNLSIGNDDVIANGTTDGKTVPGLYMDLPQDRGDLTRQEFLYELNTIIISGFHTLATQMEFMARMLAHHPDIQDKVYEELYSIYGSSDPADRPVEIEDLSRMEYLECVIHESMRLFSPVAFIGRAISKDVDIGTGVLPAGSSAIINILNLHRNEKYWPQPLKFDPDRFLPENVAKRQPGSYIPFSIGPRNCIGGKYAMMAAKILSATLLRRYILRVDTIVPVENIRLKVTFVVECVEPWKLHIEERNPEKLAAKCKIPMKDSCVKECEENKFIGEMGSSS